MFLMIKDNSNKDDFALKDLGKLVVTQYKDKYLTMLFQKNRMVAVSAISKENTQSKLDYIYIGKVKNIVHNINACFIEIDHGELCFLSLSDCIDPLIVNRDFDGRILEGDEILVQVIRDAIKTKQAVVTTKISISGEYCVFALGRPQLGISNKISLTRKEELKDLLIKDDLIDNNDLLLNKNNLISNFAEKEKITQEDLEHIPSFGVVLRTVTAKASDKDILQEFTTLSLEFLTLLHTAKHRTCFSCLKKAKHSFYLGIDDIYPDEYSEVVTDLTAIYKDLTTYIHINRRQPDVPVRLYKDDNYSLSKLYSIETKLEEATKPNIWLKSGGYLVIEPTEALTVIDVNTGKYSAKKGIEDTFYQINREAAEEIALQLRLRNISGIIIVDFINMKSTSQKEEILKYLQKLVNKDRIKTNVIDMTPLGLVEITRKKVRKSLNEQLSER